MAGLGYTDVQERKALCCVQETLPFGGGSVRVWGGICDGLGRYLWPTAVRPYCHWRKSYSTPLFAHGGYTRY